MSIDERMLDTVLGKYEGEILDCVVLDGSNIIDCSPSRDDPTFSVERLLRTIRAVHKLGWPTYVGMKRGQYNYLVTPPNPNWENYVPPNISDSDKEVLKGLVPKTISLIDAKNDDLWLWSVAIKKTGWVLSHDSYNKEIKKYSERGKEGDSEIADNIRSNRVWLEFVGSEPVFNLPMNHDSMSLTSIIDEVQIKLDEITNLEARVYRDGEEIGAIEIPYSEPVGRVLFRELDDQVSKVSRNHFIIESAGELVTITDLDSTNGTILNGLTIAPDFPNPLEDGQTNVIEVGGLEIRIDR